MISETTPIEQLIYTGGGVVREGYDHGDFGIWSASLGLDSDVRREIVSKMGRVFDGRDYEPRKRSYMDIKEGAKPVGLFKKHYKESDYEYKTEITEHGIVVIEETAQGRVLPNVVDDDYRLTPEKAPYRIATTILQDGRLMVCRVAGINRLYTHNDGRTGNRFNHALIFPTGTKISDIDVANLDFVIGLEPKYWGDNAQVAPANLPTTTLAEMKKNKQRKVQTSATETVIQESAPNNESLSAEELLTLFKLSLNEPDKQKKLQYKKQFVEQIKKGANLPQIQYLAKKEEITLIKKGVTVANIDSEVSQELAFIDSPYTILFSQVEEYLKYSIKFEQAGLNNNTQEARVMEENMQSYKLLIKSALKDLNLEEVKQACISQKRYLGAVAEAEALYAGKKFDTLSRPYATKTDYKAVRLLENAVTTMLNKGVDFDKQSSIA